MGAGGYMEIKGQRVAELLYQVIIVASAAVGFVYGAIVRSFIWCFYGWAFGTAVACLLCIPEWPIYQRDKLVFLDPKELERREQAAEDKKDAMEVKADHAADGKKKKKK